MTRPVFISYASEDKDAADAVCAALEERGIACWMAPRNILPGANYPQAILEAIQRSQLIVVILSANANASVHVGIELERALDKRKRILAVRIENTLPSGDKEYCLALCQRLDAFPPPLEMHLGELVSAVSCHVAQPAGDRSEPPLEWSSWPAADEALVQGAPVNQTTETTTGLESPGQLSSFVGRRRELEDIVGLLCDPAVRMVTLTGPGGVGKTRLGLRAVSEAARRLARQSCFIDMSEITHPEEVPAAIASAVGIQVGPEDSALDKLLNILPHRQVLLLCDSFEHLTAAAPLLGNLVSRSPGVTCLVTSRAALRIRGEHLYEVRPLPLPSPGASLGEVRRCDSVALFVERVRETSPDWQLTEANASSVAELCRQLEGIPLCLELAAARMRAMTPQEAICGLQNRLSFLSAGKLDSPERQRTLRATIDWSYHLLEDAGGLFLTQLSVFRGGFSQEAAVQVTQNDHAPELLMELLSQSLVSARPTGERTRYSALDAVREYAEEKMLAMDPSQAAVLSRRHADFFRSLAEQLQACDRSPGEAEAMAQLACDLENYRAALRWATDRDDALCAQLAARLSGLLSRIGLWDDALNWAELGLQAARRCGDERSLATLLLGLASARHDRGQLGAAAEAAREALSLWQRMGDAAGQANAQSLLGVVAQAAGDHAEARSFHEQALRLRIQDGRRVEEAISRHNLGLLAQELGEIEAARAWYNEALQIREEVGDLRGCAETHLNLGVIAQEGQDYATAMMHYRECLRIWQSLGDGASSALALNNLGEVAEATNDLDSALVLLDAAARTFRRLGSPNAAYSELGLQRVSGHQALQPFASRLQAAHETPWDEIISLAMGSR